MSSHARGDALVIHTPDHQPALVPLPNTHRGAGLGLFLDHSNVVECFVNFTHKGSDRGGDRPRRSPMRVAR